MPSNNDYIPLQDMTDEQISGLNVEQLKERDLSEFLGIDKSKLRDETRGALLKSRSVPEQFKIQMAWNKQTISREALGEVIVRRDGSLRLADLKDRTLNDFKSLTTNQALLLKSSLHALTDEQERTVLDNLRDASSRQTVEHEYTLHKIRNMSHNDWENWPLDKLKGLSLGQALAFASRLPMEEEKENTILNNLRDASGRQTVEDEYTLQKIRHLRLLGGSLDDWPLDKFKGLTKEQALEFSPNLFIGNQESTVLDHLRDKNSRQEVEDAYTLQKIRSLDGQAPENWPLDKFKDLTLQQALAFPLDLLTDQQANTLLNNLRDASGRQTVEDEYKLQKELRRTRGSNKHDLREMYVHEIRALTLVDLENRPLEEFKELPYHRAIALDSTLLTEEQEQTVLEHLVADHQTAFEFFQHGSSLQIIKDEYKRQKIQNMSRSDLENLPLDAFKNLTGEQAIALDSYSLTEEQERTVLDNLREASDRNRVEGKYILQKPFQARWNAHKKRIEYHVWSVKLHNNYWIEKNSEIYADALKIHEESHIRRERLNASSMAINPPTQANTLATPSPQTANEMALVANLIKIADRQPLAIGKEIERAIDTFRETAAGEEYNLHENQIKTLLKNNSTLDSDIARIQLKLGIPVEYLVRMAQLNKGKRPIKNMLKAIEKVIGANQSFFQNHKFLTDFEIPFERRAPLLEQLHKIRELQELQEFSYELDTNGQALRSRIDSLQMRKVSDFFSRDYASSLEDHVTETLQLLIESSSVIATHIQSDAPLLSTIESFTTRGLGDEKIHTIIGKFIDSENLPEFSVPNQMLWLEDNPSEDELALSNDIAAVPPFIDSATALVPKSVNRKIFQDLLEAAPEDLKKYFSADEENALFTINPKIFAHVENKLTAESKEHALQLIKHQMEGRELAPAEREAFADARFKLKGLKALSRICQRWPNTKDYKETSESIKKEFAEFLLTTAADTKFREANNTQFITALGACGDQVLDAVKALKTGHMTYQEERGNFSAQQSIQFRIEQARLETLGRVANLEIYAKLKNYARSDPFFQEVHIKLTLEVKVGEKLNLTTTPRHAQYHDPNIKGEQVDRALQIIDAMERGDKVAAAKHLKPLIQAAEEGIQKENQRIEAKDVDRAARGEPSLPLEKPLSAHFKDVNTWSSERELLLADQSLEFSLRREFPDSFAKRKADLEEKGREFEDIPEERAERETWDQRGKEHGKVLEQWTGDLAMSLVQVSKAARTRVQEQLSENPQETYTVQPLNGWRIQV